MAQPLLFHLIVMVLRNKSGQALIEILVALGVAAVMLPAVFVGVMTTREGRVSLTTHLTSSGLMREMYEATRAVRERGWTNFAVNGVYHPAVVSGLWQLLPGSEIVDGLVRSIQVADAQTDGLVDPSKKKIIMTVGNLVEEGYLTRYLDNLTFTQTTQVEFDAGEKLGTITTNNNGGEITLSAGGQGNWCEPNLSITALDLPKSGVANAVTAIEGLIFAGTGNNASGVSFAKVTVSNTNPPTSAVTGTFDGYKTNGVFGEQNYAYLATDSNSKEIVIIDLNNFSESGHFNAPGNGSGNSIFVSGSFGYMTSGNKFYVFDLSSKTGSRPSLGNITLAGTGNKIFVNGSYAYVVSSQLQIIDISNPSSLSVIGYIQLGATGSDIYVNATGNRAYIATTGLQIIDISNKTSPSTVSTYNTNGMSPMGVTVVTGNKAIVVGSGGEEYQVVDIVNESSPVRCGGLNIDSGVRGVVSVLEADSDAYSYIITGDASSELKIIEGGPGGRYASSGTYISSVFNPGYATSYNHLSFTANIPNQTSLTAQAAVSVNCIDFNFVGPDGTSNTFYNPIGGAIPVNLSAGSCFKYKLYLSATDSSATPVFNDITVNYSP